MIEIDLWLLVLLPVLFAAGWLARGFEARAKAQEGGAAPRSIFKGLNLLLNEQPDEAIDAFIDVVKLDPEMIDLHDALGNLFRRRGEFDRAIRVHTHLLNRADLPAKKRTQALADLGQDYLKAGMLDRAEETFERLLQDHEHRFAALRMLLHVYTVERDWPKAIDCARRLEREAAESHGVSIAHFCCQLAEGDIARGDLDAAQRRVDEALSANRKSVRATLMAGDIAHKRQDHQAATALWLGVLQADASYLPLVAKRLTAAMDALGRRQEALHLLRKHLQDTPSIDLLDITYQRMTEWEGPEAAEVLLRHALQHNPSLLGFERLLALRMAGQGAAAADTELSQLRSLLATHTQRLACYRCGHCGFRAREFYWQCPGCARWDTYPPRRIEELDT